MTSPDRRPEGDALDHLIDGALRSEATRPVPPGLFREIQGRVRVSAVVQRFRRRLWMAAGAWLGGGVVTAGSVVLAAQGMHLSDVVAQAFPGALGYADYLTSFYAVSPASGTAVLIPLAAALSLTAAVIGGSWLSSQRAPRA